jgi:RNA polymerase sigma-70 factor, ECF subfamily
MWPSPDRTEKLLADAEAQKTGAVDELLGQFREPLRKVVNLRLDPVLARRVDASDIVQDVLIEATQRLREYLKKPNMPFHLWLRHLAQDRIIDTHRRHRLAQRRSIDKEQPIQRPAWAEDSSASLVADLVDSDRTPSTEAIRLELQKKLEAAISELEDDDREIILMRHTEQLSNQDVAQAMKITEAAASMRYLRALRRLKSVLLPQSSFEDEKRSSGS